MTKYEKLRKYFVGNKTKGQISKRVLQENKVRHMFAFQKIWRALFQHLF